MSVQMNLGTTGRKWPIFGDMDISIVLFMVWRGFFLESTFFEFYTIFGKIYVLFDPFFHY